MRKLAIAPFLQNALPWLSYPPRAERAQWATARFGVLGAMEIGLLALGLGFLRPVAAQEEVAPVDPTGLCLLGDLSGRWVEGASGRMMPLREICERSPDEVPTSPDPSPPDPQAGAESSTQAVFWRAFLMAAGEEAIAFSEALPVADIVAYGTTICPMLDGGYTLQEVRTVQATSDLPAGFDAAVNVAAIHTFCPKYATQIGR
ncbi:MAG: DUF732 domain-containing protein [Synechococcales bacterium]|nr:DUF732 domain-containing protein [Synechococcales bacterium]